MMELNPWRRRASRYCSASSFVKPEMRDHGASPCTKKRCAALVDKMAMIRANPERIAIGGEAPEAGTHDEREQQRKAPWHRRFPCYGNSGGPLESISFQWLFVRKVCSRAQASTAKSALSAN